MHPRQTVVTRGLLVLSLAAVAGLLAQPGEIPACDAPVHVLARSENWARKPYTLLLAYQPGLADPKAFQQTVDKSGLEPKEDDSPIASLNLTAWTMDITGPVSWDYQDILDNGDIKAFPMLALLDAAGKPIEGAKFQSLVEARQRLAPATQGEVVSYSMRRVTPKAKPARIVIVFDSKASLDLDSPLAATQPEDGRGSLGRGGILRSSDKVERVPTRQLAQRWVTELQAEPLAGLNSADLVDLRRPGDQAKTVAALALKPLPLCVLVDGMNRTIATFDVLPGKDDLRRIAYSPVRDQIIKLLNADGGTMCLLSVRGTDKKANANADAAIKQAIKLSGKPVPVIDVDGADKAEEFLLKQFDFKLGQGEPMVVPVFGQGKILEPSTPDKKHEMDATGILEAIQFVYNNGCRDMPAGYDLLLGASEALPPAARKWAPVTQPEPTAQAEE